MYKVINLNFSLAMQMKKVIFVVLFTLGFISINAQIKINEYNISNKVNADALVPPGTPDYVEIFNNQLTPQSFSVNVYYLTNDKTNLFKWKIPGAITLPPNGFVTFWCDGKDVKEPGVGGRYHTNFDIKQCKDKWLMLVRNNGVVADSVLIRNTKIGDTWGKYPDGSNVWRLFQGGGGLLPDVPNITNPAANVYFGYAPTPVFMNPAGWPGAAAPNFFAIGDTVNFEIHYTASDCQTFKDGTAPCLTEGGCLPAPTTYVYIDETSTPLQQVPYPMGTTTMIRALTIPKTSNTSNTIIGTPAYYTYTPTIAQMYLPSFVETNTYFDGADLLVNPGFGVLSVASPSAYPEISPGTILFPPAGGSTLHVEYFDKLKLNSEGYANLTKPVNDGWLNEQKAFNVGFDDETGFGCEMSGQVFNDPTFGVSARTGITDFAVKCAGVDNFSQLTPTVSTYTLTGTHLRDAFAQTYAITNNLNMDGLHYKPIKTFLNGCYWGVYEFRELADVNYTNYYYKHHKDSTDILGTYAGNLINAGSDTAWFTTPVATFTTGVFNQVQMFYSLINTFNWYQRIMVRLDQKSFMDFMIYNSYMVNADLMGLNNSWWRGFTPSILKSDSTFSKWRYFMWDMNNILGLALNPKTLPLSATNMSVSPCVYTQSLTATLTQTTAAAAYNGHGFILKALLQNPTFKNDYLNRWMDLLNTTLRCDKLLAHFQYFRNIFTPEIQNFHTLTPPVPWATINFTEWDANMDTLKQRITTRCAITQSLLAKPVCYNFNGPYTINIDVKPIGSGNVNFNSLQLSSYVWSGTYYQNKIAPYLLSYLKAIPIDTNKYIFDHWEWTACCTNSTTATPGTIVHQNMLGADSISIVISSSDNITAVFTDRRDDIVLPTGFTPNGDGHNDVFSPLGPATRFARDYEFQIWNRWGQEVYRTADVNLGWDGNFNGNQAQTGVYAYLVKYKSIQNEYKQIKGNVTLIR